MPSRLSGLDKDVRQSVNEESIRAASLFTVPEATSQGSDLSTCQPASVCEIALHPASATRH